MADARDQFDQRLIETFKRLGLTESAAAVAARGRELTEIQAALARRQGARHTAAADPFAGQFVTLPDGRRISAAQSIHESVARSAGLSDAAAQAYVQARLAGRSDEMAMVEARALSRAASSPRANLSKSRSVRADVRPARLNEAVSCPCGVVHASARCPGCGRSR